MPSPCDAKLESFFQEQLAEWPMLAQAMQALTEVKTREIESKGDRAKIHFNPARIRSVAAKVDTASLAARPCFLCESNRPTEQRALPLLPGFVALCNPVPIFERHYTINHIQHSAQIISPHIEQFLNLSKFIGENLCLFFNGALAGASAPDHLHFQCCNTKETLPLITKVLAGNTTKLSMNFGCELSLSSFFGVGAIVAQSRSRDALLQLTTKILEHLGRIREHGADLINIVANFRNGEWLITFIPRKRHRPECYSKSGEQQLLISPGTVEVCGSVITARQEDFSKITATDLLGIFGEVAYSENECDELVRSL